MSADVTTSLPARWRLLGDDERSSLGDLTTDESVRLIAVSDRQVGEYHPTLVVTGGELDTEDSDEAVYADSALRLSETFPGFHMIDDYAWPVNPKGARLRTGIYILDDLSLTVSQWVWITHQRSQGNGRVLWSATGTSPTILYPDMLKDFVDMIPSVEVAL